MSEAPLSNRPTPRTTAAVEAELRRLIRVDIAQAREDGDGELDDASLASIIARAIGMALGWHLESPEHSRNATSSSRAWRPAGGPRGGRAPEFDARAPQERGPRQFDDRPRRPPPNRPPFSDGGPRDFGDRPSGPRRPPREDTRDFPPPPRRGPRDDDRDRDRDRDRNFPPARGGPRGGGRPLNRPGGGGGFGPRRPPPRGR
jgi:hypothetical protein